MPCHWAKAWRVLCRAALLAVGAAALVPHHGPASTLIKRQRALGAWRVTIVRDPFSAEVQCRLSRRDRRAFYIANAIGFRFDRHRDVTRGWYRVDGAVAKQWRDALPELVRLGVDIDGPQLDSPTGGIMWLPSAWLDQANWVEIEPQPGKKARRIGLRGFADLRDIARTQGCAPEARFIR